MLIFALFSFFPQWIAPYSPKDMFEPWAPMSASHWLGTNDMGYDILSELIYAASTTMLVGITASFISLAVGVLVGIAAGYFQGWLGRSDKWIDSYIFVNSHASHDDYLGCIPGGRSSKCDSIHLFVGMVFNRKGGQSQNQTSKMRSFY